MNPAALEDRLRAHFAERAEHEPVEPPDPARIVAAARGRTGARAGRHAGARPYRRTWRLAVAGGLAAACLAVAAVVATGDDPERTDIRNPGTTVTAERPTPTTTVPETTDPEPTTSSTASPTAIATGSLILSREGVLGAWDGNGWVSFAGARPPAQGGEEYQLVRLGQPVTAVRGAVPEPHLCSPVESYRIDLGLDQGFEGVAVTGVAEAQPRPVTVLDPATAGYQADAGRALAELGIDDPAPPVHQVVRADLDGDGTDEVLIEVERPGGAPVLSAGQGDYSVVLLRRLVGGSVRTSVVAADVVGPPPEAIVEVNDIAAVADLNGDGRMEVVVASAYYEGNSTTAYELQGDALVEVLAVGCGV